MDQNPKQQVAEKLRTSANVLITVSKNPSVDQLAAAIGLSLMLDALGKHTATVFSGQIPDILKFLEPEKTFDNNVDGLRDFIISLDKEKADKLRYKVEDDVVKIYITPYRSKITENDLLFTQGDFNVDVVMALGVKKKADLDEAITAHGRILHDAAVVAVNAGEVGGDVGSVDWTDPNANSLCEMLVSISEALEGGVLDAAMSTAFLTGIVSVTDRFSNDRTTPKLMTMAAQLMAAGANQQLISKELQITGEKPVPNKVEKEQQKQDGATFDLHNDKKAKKNKHKDKVEEIKDAIVNDIKLDELEKKLQNAEASGSLSGDEPSEPEVEVEPEEKVDREPTFEAFADAPTEETKPAQELPDMGVELPAPQPATPDPLTDLDLPKIEKRNEGTQLGDMPLNPSLGGTFNATTEEAAEAKQEEMRDGLNDEILSHKIDPIGTPAADTSAPDLGMPTPPAPQTAATTDFALPPMPQPSPATAAPAFPPVEAQQPQAPAPVVDVEANLEEARRAVEQAAMQTPYNPAGNPLQSINAQPMSADEPQVLEHNQPPAAPIAPPSPATPPTMPPPMPPPMPPNMPMGFTPPPPPPGNNQMFNIPTPQQMGQQFPPPPPAFNQQPMGMPPAPVDTSQLPPPPPMQQ